MGIHATANNMSWKKSGKLMDAIRHYANFPATGVSLRQMVQFGEKPSAGELKNIPAALVSVRPYLHSVPCKRLPGWY